MGMLIKLCSENVLLVIFLALAAPLLFLIKKKGASRAARHAFWLHLALVLIALFVFALAKFSGLII